jgi:hypothetical protein
MLQKNWREKSRASPAFFKGVANLSGVAARLVLKRDA